MRFFTSDQHFGHARINELAGRPFSSVGEMNEALIERWNRIVSPDDTVFVLGDFALGPIAESLACGLRLNGTKHLILGNHDRPFIRRDKTDRHAWATRYLDEAGFATVMTGTMVWLACRWVRLSHFPYAGDSHSQDRFLADRPKEDGKWLLHGHTHSRSQVNGRQIHVGVDAWGFRPASELEIEALIQVGEGEYSAPPAV